MYCCHAPLNSVCQLKLWKWKLIYKLQAYETLPTSVSEIPQHSDRGLWCRRTLKLCFQGVGFSFCCVLDTYTLNCPSNVVFTSELHIVCAPSHAMLCKTLCNSVLLTVIVNKTGALKLHPPCACDIRHEWNAKPRTITLWGTLLLLIPSLLSNNQGGAETS